MAVMFRSGSRGPQKCNWCCVCVVLYVFVLLFWFIEHTTKWFDFGIRAASHNTAKLDKKKCLFNQILQMPAGSQQMMYPLSAMCWIHVSSFIIVMTW